MRRSRVPRKDEDPCLEDEWKGKKSWRCEKRGSRQPLEPTKLGVVSFPRCRSVGGRTCHDWPWTKASCMPRHEGLLAQPHAKTLLLRLRPDHGFPPPVQPRPILTLFGQGSSSFQASIGVRLGLRAKARSLRESGPKQVAGCPLALPLPLPPVTTTLQSHPHSLVVR